MRKKYFLIIVASLIMAFTLSGCLDLFAVPGVAVSPDGSTVYFLGGYDMMATDSTQISTLLSATLSDGQTQTIMSAEGKNALVGAFAVSPTTGDLAFLVATEEPRETKLMIYNVAAGMRELAKSPDLPSTGIGTLMQFSPDGNTIAMTLISIPEDMTLDTLGSESALTPDQLKLIKSGVYLVDVNSGAISVVSNLDSEWANALDWNPSGSMLTYNAWIDSNADGAIDFSGGLGSMMTMSATAGDLSQLFVYDVAAGSARKLESQRADYAPQFVSDNQLAYVYLNLSGLMMGGGSGIAVYDLGAGSSADVHSTAGLVMGIALSPDGSQVAWTESGDTSSAMASGTEDTTTTPNYLFVADTAFSSPRQVAELSGELGLVDTPVWMPDSKSVLVTSTNLSATLMGSLSGAMSGLGEMAQDMGATMEPTEAMPQQQILLFDVASGENTVVYTGSMANSNIWATSLSMISISSSMEGMMPPQ